VTGEGRVSGEPPVGRRPTPLFRAFAVCPPGFEDLVEAELRELGLCVEGSGVGGVEFAASWPDVWRVNLWSRLASRVLVRVAEFEATGFPGLRRGLRSVDWGEWLPRGCSLAPRVSKSRTRLYHTGKVAEEVVGVLSSQHDVRAAHPAEATAALYVRIQGPRVSVSLDTSGAHLHRRGYRSERAEAPLRENLAAGLIRRAGWTGGEAFLDPLCGSGTLAVEAALLGMGRAPGLNRSFGFEALPSFREERWAGLKDEAEAAAKPAPPAPVFASDGDAAAVERTARTARRAGVADHVQVACCPVEELEAPAPAGLVVANPPYGRRLGGARSALRALGGALAGRLGAWRWAVVLPGPRTPWGAEAKAAHAFTNGGLRRWLVAGGPPESRGRAAGEGT
jgi:putative N6-adenine-specific DNA methylase